MVTAYLLAATVSTPIWGKLGDLLGRKRMYQVAILVFLVGSVLSGLSTTMVQLIAFRFIQGIGGGALIVLAQAIIADVVSPRERGRYQGYFGALFAASSVAGPLLGGFFTDNLSWRWIFYINIPLGILALIVTSAVLPAAVTRGKVVIDYIGAGLLTAAITGIVLVTTWGGTEYAWSSPTIIVLSVTSVALLVAFLAVERRATEPLLPLRLFRGPIFSISSSVSFVIGVAMFGCISFLPLFLQVAGGASATDSGLLLVPLMIGMLGASVFSGQVITRTGRYRVLPIVGTGIAATGLLLLSTMDAGTPRLESGIYMTTLGIGLGLSMQVLILATQNSVKVSDLGVATSSVNFFRSVGGSVGVALFGALFNARLSSGLSGADQRDHHPAGDRGPSRGPAGDGGRHLRQRPDQRLPHRRARDARGLRPQLVPAGGPPPVLLRLDPGPRPGRRGRRPRGRPHRDRPRGLIRAVARPHPDRDGTVGTRPAAAGHRPPPGRPSGSGP